ncbi:MAG: hypothetical protein NC828_04435, partial [Candidatus Omnitrophica bacterium]|nr:hypothetical protein [Candidatus Omnitrophota bacterium]
MVQVVGCISIMSQTLQTPRKSQGIIPLNKKMKLWFQATMLISVVWMMVYPLWMLQTHIIP